MLIVLVGAHIGGFLDMKASLGEGLIHFFPSFQQRDEWQVEFWSIRLLEHSILNSMCFEQTLTSLHQALWYVTVTKLADERTRSKIMFACTTNLDPEENRCIPAVQLMLRTDNFEWLRWYYSKRNFTWTITRTTSFYVSMGKLEITPRNNLSG